MSHRVLQIGVLILALLGMTLAFAACGGDDASDDEISQAREEGAKEAEQQAKIEQIEKELKAVRKKGGSGGSGGSRSSGGGAYYGGGSSGGSSSCGGELSVGANTTCPFAENVRDAYYSEIGTGSGTVIAYSPVTDITYDMYCTAGSPHVCTGGNDASVYFP